VVKIKRVYDASAPSDGRRFLVERLWPRGLKKEQLKLDAWLKDAAPSTELRKWFNHDPAKWKKFQRRYEAELRTRPEAWQPILEADSKGAVTLLFSSHDAEHNNVVVLRDFLAKKEQKASATSNSCSLSQTGG
jgi:uncharacterized protein YeaO (DUF488 family)